MNIRLVLRFKSHWTFNFYVYPKTQNISKTVNNCYNLEKISRRLGTTTSPLSKAADGLKSNYNMHVNACFIKPKR